MKYFSVSLVKLLTISNLLRAVKEEIWSRRHQTPMLLRRYLFLLLSEPSVFMFVILILKILNVLNMCQHCCPTVIILLKIVITVI